MVSAIFLRPSARLLLPSGTLRKKAVGRNIEGLGEEKKLSVFDASNLCFNLGNGSAADVEAMQLAVGGELLLGQAQFVAPFLNLFPDNICRFLGSGHAKK